MLRERKSAKERRKETILYNNSVEKSHFYFSRSTLNVGRSNKYEPITRTHTYTQTFREAARDCKSQQIYTPLEIEIGSCVSLIFFLLYFISLSISDIATIESYISNMSIHSYMVHNTPFWGRIQLNCRNCRKKNEKKIWIHIDVHYKLLCIAFN